MTADDLRSFMDQRAWTKRQTADAFGCSRQTLDNYLSGKHAIPTTFALAAAALAYGLKPYRTPAVAA